VLRRFASQGALNSPWAWPWRRATSASSAMPCSSEFRQRKINAYDLLTGKYLGQMTQSNGDPLVIEGLWGLAFEKDEVLDRESLFSADRLYFTAGPNDEDDGVVGIIRPVDRSAR